MGHFVKPDTAVLTLPDGEKVIVRRRLNVGQERARMARMYVAGVDRDMTVNIFEVGRSTVLAYLVDWTLTDDDGAPVVIRGLAVDDLAIVLDNLTPEVFRDVRIAIDAHEEKETAARAAEKKTIAGGVSA